MCDAETKALIVYDAVLLGEEAAATKHGISSRTVRRYKAESATNPELSELVQEKRRVISESLTESARETTRKLLAWMGESSELLDKNDRLNLYTITGAAKIAAEIATGLTFIDARTSQQTASTGAQSGANDDSADLLPNKPEPEPEPA